MHGGCALIPCKGTVTRCGNGLKPALPDDYLNTEQGVAAGVVHSCGLKEGALCFKRAVCIHAIRLCPTSHRDLGDDC